MIRRSLLGIAAAWAGTYAGAALMLTPWEPVQLAGAALLVLGLCYVGYLAAVLATWLWSR